MDVHHQYCSTTMIKVDMSFFPLEKVENLHNGYRRHFIVEERSLLLLQINDTPHLIENSCGHFGAPLDEGEVVDGAIACPQHGISFNLETGEIANRPYENADPIKIFKVTYQDGFLGFIPDD